MYFEQQGIARKKTVITLLAVVLAVTGIVYLALLANSAMNHSARATRICFDHGCYVVEVARTPAERQRGLMERTGLPPDGGMLFIFERSDYHGFWMKNTLIPLDMLWLDTDFRVVHIEREVPPCKNGTCPSYRPAVAARYVLEVTAGAAADIAVGDSAQVSGL